MNIHPICKCKSDVADQCAKDVIVAIETHKMMSGMFESMFSSKQSPYDNFPAGYRPSDMDNDN
jgi:hypothetical protein